MKYQIQWHRSLHFTCMFNILCFYMHHIQKSCGTRNLCHTDSLLEILSQSILYFTARFLFNRGGFKINLVLNSKECKKQGLKQKYILNDLPAIWWWQFEQIWMWLQLGGIVPIKHWPAFKNLTNRSHCKWRWKHLYISVTKNKWKPTVMWSCEIMNGRQQHGTT